MKKYVSERRTPNLMFVVEKPTGNIMFAGLPSTGKELVNNLNGGCGFNGYTPRFMFNRFIVSELQPQQDILIEGKIHV